MKVENLTITKVLEVQKGTSQAGKDWQKLTFVGETNEQYNNIYAFEIFGDEKVENFTKFNKVGDVVDVDFNVSCNEWKGKYFTSLSCWKVFKSENSAPTSAPDPQLETSSDDNLDLPF